MLEDKTKERTQMDNALEVRQAKYSTYLDTLQEGTQNYIILERLIQKGSITTIEAFFDFYITRLSARIYDLRAMGVDIETNTITKRSKKGATQSYAVYRLADDGTDI